MRRTVHPTPTHSDAADAIGRERLRTAPAWHVTELATDAVLVQSVLNPIHLGADWFESRQELSAHFGQS